MSAHSTPRRARRAAGITACLAVTAGLATGLVPGPAHAAPAEDCAAAYPVASVASGAPVTGLTVDRGSAPAGFTGEVLGVVKNGLGAGRDMVMVELDSPAIAKAGGIWAGMSGSPVYAGDGRLIGAVAYGLSYGSTPIAGVTPYQYMAGYLDAGGAGPAGGTGGAAHRPEAGRERVAVDKRAIRVLAETGEVTAAQASAGFRRLPVPMSVSGLDQPRLDGLADRPYLPKDVQAGGSAGGGGAGIDTVVAGGNLAFLWSDGDVTYGGVGTATSVCQGRVVGFGHPIEGTGVVAFGLASADAVYVQPDPLGVAYKVVNIGELGGTITDDRLAGIAGNFGPSPDAATFTSDVRYGDVRRKGRTEVYVPDALSSVAFYGAVANHDTVMDHVGSGTEDQVWLINGLVTGAAGKPKPFSITYDDLFASSRDIGGNASYSLADVLDRVTRFKGVTVSSATSIGEVSEWRGAYNVKRIEQYVDDTWVPVKKKAVVQAGTDLQLRIHLKGKAGETSVRVTTRIPQKAKGASGQLTIVGGNSTYTSIYGTKDVAELQKRLDGAVRGDAVGVSGTLKGGPEDVVLALESDTVDSVVRKHKYLTLTVK